MASCRIGRGVFSRSRRAAWNLAFLGIALACVSPRAESKEPSLLALEIYDGPSGAAYLQITDFLINGKAEMRDCGPFQNASVDKSTYGKMGKVLLGPGGVLERGADGILHYTPPQGVPLCVVPANVKFDHNGSYSLSELADAGIPHGTPVGPGATAATAVPAIAKTVKLVFLAAPNPELGEFLRAQRASDIPGWQDFIAHYPASSHLGDAKTALAQLFVGVGEASLQKYGKTRAMPTPAYADLKDAKKQLDLAHGLNSTLPAAQALSSEVLKEFAAITDKGRAELDAYRAALAAQGPGYVHLKNAKGFADIMGGIDSYFPPEQTLLVEVQKDLNSIEAAIKSAEAAESGSEFDQAYAFIVPFRAFADEEPRLAAVVDAAYNSHMDLAKASAKVLNWDGAIKEYERAVHDKETPEAKDALADAHTQLIRAKDKAAIDQALESSGDYQKQKKMVPAYEVLSSLPPKLREQVADTMKELEPEYILAAAAEAKSLHQIHSPIRGPGDEFWIEKAYADLKNAYKLSQDESYKDKMDIYGDEMSAYLLDQANGYLAKPGGSGVELGFTCLEEARQYRANNFDKVRDAIVSAGPAHSMRSKLSIRVQFRDQTTQGDRANFAARLENAIISGLEDSGVPVKVVRVGETTPVEPDFELDGDVLTHSLSVVPTKESLESKYLLGVEQVPNEEWNIQNHALEKAKAQLDAAQLGLSAAAAKGKKERQEAGDAFAAATKAFGEETDKLDRMNRTKPKDDIRSYAYTRLTTDINGVIQLQFRIENSLNGQTTKTDPIERKSKKQDVQLLDVRGDDVLGVKSSGTASDPQEFMNELENSVRDELIAKVREKVNELPLKMYELAKGREDEEDLVGAGELYLRFLNITHDNNSPEGTHATQFLKEKFDLSPVTEAAN